MHEPPLHDEVCVQALPSSHAVPFTAFVGVGHMPLVGLQVPATLHGGAEHVLAAPATQVPFWQVSSTVQLLPSVHGVPFVAGAQAPVAIEQMEHPPHLAPTFCQTPFSSQDCGCRPLQLTAPGMHVPVQAPP